MRAKPQPRARTFSLALLAGLFALGTLGAAADAAGQRRAAKKNTGVSVTKAPPPPVGTLDTDRALAGTHRFEKQATRKPGKRGWLNTVVFYLIASLCIVFAVVMVTRKSPMMAALSLLVVFLCLAGIYLYLHAPFMAAIQLIVYAGAVIVLFVFVIMSTGFNEERSLTDLGTEIGYFFAGFVITGGAAVAFHFLEGPQSLILFVALEVVGLGVCLWVLSFPFTRFLGLAAGTFALVQIMKLVALTPVGIFGPSEIVPKERTAVIGAKMVNADFGSAKSVGVAVFRDNVFAFEALSLLLLAAVVAAVVIVRSRKEQS